MDKTIDLYREDDAYGGTRRVWLRLRRDRTLVLEGQDLGGAVTEIFGADSHEYEWAWSLPPARRHLLLDALGLAAEAPDLLHQVAARLRQLDGAEMQERFREAGAEFWNRVGD